MKKVAFLSLFALIFSISSCKSDKKTGASKASDTAQTTQSAKLLDGEYMIDPSASLINWRGNAPTKFHTGTVPIKSGKLSVVDKKIVSGTFELDLTNMTNSDLEADDRDNLLAHLKGTVKGKEDDFFNVTKYPTGSFKIKKVTKLANDEDFNSLVYGDLTLKGVTHPVSFKAQITTNASGLTAASNNFVIDRTKWGINFMSKTVFDKLKDRFIDDKVELSVIITAKK